MGVISNLMFAVGFKVTSKDLTKADNEINKLKGTTNGLGDSIDQARKSNIGFANSFKNFSQHEGALGKIKTGFAGIAQVAAPLLGVGVGVGIGAGIASGLSSVNDLQVSLNDLAAKTGLSGENMKDLNGQMLSIYKNNYGKDFNDIGNSMSTVVQQMFDDVPFEGLGKATEKAILLRDTFEFDVKDSVRSATNLIKTFGIDSDQAFNMIAQGAQLGLDKNGDMLDTLNEYAPQFKSLGFNAEGMFNTLVSGAANGAFSIDKVGDAIKEFNIRAKDGSKLTIQSFQALGLDANKTMQTFAKGGPEAQKTFVDVAKSIAQIKDPVKQNEIAVGLFGTQFEDLEKNVVLGFANIGTEVKAGKDTLGQIANIKFDTFSGSMSGIGRIISADLIMPLGEKLLPYANQFAGWLQQNLPQAIGIASGVIDNIGEKIGFVADNFNIIGPAVGAFALVIGIGLAPALWAAAAAGWAAVAPWLPFIAIGLAVAAVVAGIAYAFTHWGDIVAWFGSKWTEVKAAIFNAVNSFTSINLYDIGINIIQGLINGVKSMASNVWNAIKEIAGGITDSIKGALGIHSPSRVMMEVGYFTGEGLAQGIAGSAQSVSAASGDLANETLDGYSQGAASYTPVSAPAIVTNRNSNSATNNTFEITINVNGGAGANVGSDIAAQVKKVVQEIIESSFRREGLPEGAN